MSQPHAAHAARVPALDGVRGLATVGVLIAHFEFHDVYDTHLYWKFAHSGWMGVDLFFALSGFLITGILLHTKGRSNYFRQFYWRRLLRIFPLYYTVLVYAALTIVLLERAPERLWQGYDALAWFFGFIPNVAMALKGDWHWSGNWAGLSHLWSLAVEEQFYVVWPMVVLLMPARGLPWLCAGLIAISPQLRALTEAQFGNNVASYMLPYCRMDGLAAGSLLAALRFNGHFTTQAPQRQLFRDILVSCAFAIGYIMLAIETPWRETFIGLACMSFIYLALCPGGLVHWFCNNALLRHLGHYSYGLYIFHQLLYMPFTWWIREPLEATGLPILAVQLLYIPIVFAISYGLARLSWRFIEKPFLDRK